MLASIKTQPVANSLILSMIPKIDPVKLTIKKNKTVHFFMRVLSLHPFLKKNSTGNINPIPQEQMHPTNDINTAKSGTRNAKQTKVILQTTRLEIKYINDSHESSFATSLPKIVLFNQIQRGKSYKG